MNKYNIGIRIVGYVFILGVILVFSSNTNAQRRYMRCDYWQSKVSSAIKARGSKKQTASSLRILLRNNNFVIEKPFRDLGEKEVFYGIACLLKLEGKKGNSNLLGAVRPDVSQTFDSTTIEVAALYYISYLFFQKWDHAAAPFLITTENNGLNSKIAVSKAYRSYRTWFRKIKELGLHEAREQVLDPLDGSGVNWY